MSMKITFVINTSLISFIKHQNPERSGKLLDTLVIMPNAEMLSPPLLSVIDQI